MYRKFSACGNKSKATPTWEILSIVYGEMASSRGDSFLAVSLEPAPNYLTLAHKELTDIPREACEDLASVEILDLSHNNVSYPSAYYSIRS